MAELKFSFVLLSWVVVLIEFDELVVGQSTTGNQYTNQCGQSKQVQYVEEKMDLMRQVVSSELRNVQTEIQRQLQRHHENMTRMVAVIPCTRAEPESTSNERVETGSNYIRWGRTTCGAASSVIYKGQVAGAEFRVQSGGGGGGANYQCMPETPQWLNYTTLGGWNSFIYGVQYQIFPGSVFSMSNNGGNNISPNPVACVACFSPRRSSQLMIPARKECPAGWTLEYRGYLTAEYVGEGRHPKNYICMDEAPEVGSGEPNQAQFQNKGLLYPVRVQCGALLCSKYINNREIVCVVCTR